MILLTHLQLEPRIQAPETEVPNDLPGGPVRVLVPVAGRHGAEVAARIVVRHLLGNDHGALGQLKGT